MAVKRALDATYSECFTTFSSISFNMKYSVVQVDPTIGCAGLEEATSTLRNTCLWSQFSHLPSIKMGGSFRVRLGAVGVKK